MGCSNNYCSLCSVGLILEMRRLALEWGCRTRLTVMRTGFPRAPPVPDGDAVRKRNHYLKRAFFFEAIFGSSETSIPFLLN